ncbi:MAG: 30S ribosomal protein S7, partial [Methylobacter sp.]|nr:30S ribosomal protein S7 [Methylobacter sp.]
MSRRRVATKREIIPDPRFGSVMLTKFMNMIMESGKKSIAEGIVYGALDVIESKGHSEPLEVLSKALENVQPRVEVKSRRVGGATYQVPVEV